MVDGRDVVCDIGDCNCFGEYWRCYEETYKDCWVYLNEEKPEEIR